MPRSLRTWAVLYGAHRRAGLGTCPGGRITRPPRCRAHPRLAAGHQGPIVDLNVEFFDPTEPDFHAVKMLLNEYLPKQDVQSWAQSALVELILAQVRQPPPCAPILAGR